MDATQMINDSILESDEGETEEENENKRGKPLATLCILKNDHIPEKEMPLFLGENVLGRDPNTCNLPLPSPSISKQHATISISAFRKRGQRGEVDVEALIWDLGSLNGTRKGRLKLTPNVRYALSECDGLVVADIPCQYISCSAHKVAAPDQFKMPARRGSGSKARLDDILKEKESGDKKCVNGTPESGRTRLDVKDGGDNPISTYLFCEQTPAQSQRTLVPESDLDSDDEGGGRGDGRHKTLSSLSDSCKETPTSSHLLSPLNQTVPESEDESPIAPSDLAKNRPLRHASLNKEEKDAYVGQKELEQKEVFALLDDSDDETEEEEKEEGVALEQKKSEKRGPPVATNKEGSVILQGADESPVSASAVALNAIPAFNMDSDTDVEGEDEKEVPSTVPVTSSTDQQADHPSDRGSFHMDSDTDVDEDVEKEVSGGLPSSVAIPSHNIPAIQAEHMYMDSDTDMEDDAEEKEGTEVTPSAHTGAAAATLQIKDFNLDSDTDVEEHGKETDQTPSRLDVKAVETKPSLTAPSCLQTDSETDDEAHPVSPVAANTKVCSKKTCVAEDPPEVAPIAVTALSHAPAPLSGSDADTDVDESSGPPDDNRVGPADLHMDSDTDVEDERGIGVAAEDQAPSLCRSSTPGFLNPPLQKFSTPVYLPGALPLIMGSKRTTSCSDSQEDNVFVVAETQSFVLQAEKSHVENPVCHECSGEEGNERSTEGASFQLGLSDSSHLQERAQALALESTQAFVLVDADGHPSSSHPDRVLSENDAGQTCEAVETSNQRGSQVNVALEATQLYILGHCKESEIETVDDVARDITTIETQAFKLPTSSTLEMAETQPMCAFEEEGSLDGMENDKAVPSQDKPNSVPKTHLLLETQPVLLIDEEEITDEDSLPILQKRKAKPLELEKEQTQPLVSCDVALLETQPVSSTDDEEITDEDSLPVLRKRKAKPLESEEEQTQPLVSCNVALLETQPVLLINEEEITDEDSLPVLRKTKVKPLESEEKQTQLLTSCDVALPETQPVLPIDEDNEDSVPVLHKRKVKLLPQLEEEKTEPLSSCYLALAETQPLHFSVDETMDKGSNEQSDGEDSISEPCRKQTKLFPSQDKELQTLVGSDLSAETQPKFTGEDGDSDDDNSIIGFSRRKAKPLESQEEESQTLSLTASEKPPVLADDIDESEDLDSTLGLRKKRARPLPLEEDDSQSLPGSGVSAFGKQLSETEATGQQEGDASQSESRGSISRDSRAMRPTFRQEEKELAECAKTEEKSRAHENDNRKEEKKQAKRKTSKMQEEEKVEENEPFPNGGLTKGQQAIKRDTSDLRQVTERSEEKKTDEMETKEIKEEEKIVFVKAEKPKLEQETMEEEVIVKHKKEKDDKERTDQEKKENGQQLHKKKEDKERLDCEKGKKEQKRLSKEENEGLQSKTQEKEEKATLKNLGAQVGSKLLARAKKEVEKNSIDHQQQNQPLPARGRRASRRTTAAVSPAEPEQQASTNDIPVRRTRSRSNSSNSVGSELSTTGPDSQQSQGRGRGRGRGARRSSKPPSTVLASSSSGRKTTAAAPPSKRNSMARGQKEVKSECIEAHVTPPASAESGGQRRVRKRTSGANIENVSSSCCKISKAVEEEEVEEDQGETATSEAQEEVSARPIRGGRAKPKKEAVKETPDEVEVKNDDVVEVGRRRVRGRSAVDSQRRKDEQGVNDGSLVELEPPRTPAGGASRKRQASAASFPAAKTSRSSPASPAPGARSRSACPAYKVLFTGVVDQAGEKVLARLGGCMANGVANMTCLVTDKVRRTVKFLCALAKGVPIVTTDWLEESGKAGAFLPTAPFFVKDPEQEKKFSFCLLESLRVASSQPVLQGYKIHVTKSVKPEPVHMKDIFSCSGATFLPKMPSTHKPQTVVVSCEEDWHLCAPALSASIPIVTAEFILTGVLRQKLDVQSNLLSSPANIEQPVRGRRQSRKKT